MLIILGSIFVIALTGLTGCGEKQEKSSESSIEVDIDEEQKQIEMSETKEESNTESSTYERENSSIKRTALSDTGVQSLERNILPEGVAPELTYFTYDDVEGMVKAQQYLEEIGVSEENKTIVVCQKQEFAGDALRIFVISFEDDGTYRQEFYFESGSGSYELMLDEMITNSEYCDSDARYIRTEKMEDPTVDSYEEEIQYYESFEELFTVAK